MGELVGEKAFNGDDGVPLNGVALVAPCGVAGGNVEFDGDVEPEVVDESCPCLLQRLAPLA